jgi:hypothetical protein
LDLRNALIAELAKEAALATRRGKDARRGLPVAPHPDPDFFPEIVAAVVEIRDPAAIPAVASALGSGFRAIRFLADFGESAAPAVLAVVMSPESINYAVDDGLIALRFMVERRSVRPLSQSTMAQIRLAVQQHLSTGRDFAIGTLWWAIDLASVLKDPDLDGTIRLLATDTNAIRSLGVAPDLVQETQKRAADRVAGILPLPRW